MLDATVAKLNFWKARNTIGIASNVDLISAEVVLSLLIRRIIIISLLRRSKNSKTTSLMISKMPFSILN